jgi:hypothetical protein
MPSIFPPHFILLVASGYLVRALNRKPPFWERLWHGLRYISTPHAQDITNVLTAASGATAAPGSVERLAGEALDVSLRMIPWSYFPLQHVPWDRLVGAESLGMVIVTALYAGVGFALVQLWVRTVPHSVTSCHAAIALLYLVCSAAPCCCPHSYTPHLLLNRRVLPAALAARCMLTLLSQSQP